MNACNKALQYSINMDLLIHRKHPSQCNKIEPGLYLGGFDAAEQIETLRHLNITHVLTVASFPVPRTESLQIQYYFVEAEDWDDENLLTAFPKAIDFIMEGQRKGTCLVHCLAGISRSATLVIAFIMQKYGLPLSEALKRVEEKRPCISPNEGFLSQLKLFEVMKWTIDRENSGYKVFALHHLSKKVRDKKFELINEYIEEFSGNKLLGGQFKCRICRQYLFAGSHVIHHFEAKDFDETDLQLQCFDTLESSLCTKSLLIQPLSWMTDIFHSLEGKLYCPKCTKKVGTFSWEGERCACGALTEPCFKICRSKIDVENVTSTEANLAGPAIEMNL